MEEIKENLEKLTKLYVDKNQLEQLEKEVNEKQDELVDLNKKIQLTMLGSVDREIENEKLKAVKEEFEKMQKHQEQEIETLNEKFENYKKSLLSKIDEEMAKYKRKSELENLKSQKNAYEKVAENAERTVQKLTNDFNEGKVIDQKMLSNARDEIKYNKERAGKIGKELEGYIELESNVEQYSDLEYLKIRIRGLELYQLNEKTEHAFYHKYFEEAKEQEKTEKEKATEKIKGEKVEKTNTEPDVSEIIQDEMERVMGTESEKTDVKTNTESDVSEIIQGEIERTIRAESGTEKTENEPDVNGIIRDGVNRVVGTEKQIIEDPDMSEIIKDEVSRVTKEDINIEISAKDDKVYINGKEIINLSIQEVLENKKDIFKDNKIKELIKEELEIKNPLKIFNIKRKMDPVIIEALATREKSEAENLIRDYIWALQDKTLENYYTKKYINILYNLENSTWNEEVDKKMQKYARHAEKVDGIEVKGLKETGFKAWFKNIMNKITRPKLGKGKETEKVNNQQWTKTNTVTQKAQDPKTTGKDNNKQVDKDVDFGKMWRESQKVDKKPIIVKLDNGTEVEILEPEKTTNEKDR